MDVVLPDGRKVVLDENLNIDEKLAEVNRLLDESLDFIIDSRDSNKVKFFLESLANYLVWHKEGREEGKRGVEDKEILSKKKVEKMERFKATTKEITTSNLPPAQRNFILGDGGEDL